MGVVLPRFKAFGPVTRASIKLLVAFTIISDFVVPSSKMPLLKILGPIWMLRNDQWNCCVDFGIIVVVGYYFGAFSDLVPKWILQTRVMEFQIFVFLILLMVFAGFIVWRGEDDVHQKAAGVDEIEKPLLPPLLLPGRTTHTRMFPEKHSFEYSYFSVGIPVGWKGCAGSLLSADVELLEPRQRRRGWFNINASDYLYRGGTERGLKARLGHYLRGEGVKDEDWSFAYLVTAPRFLGYSFNPVSFWYIYDHSERLSMMVLEVNNTFGERRLYLLKAEGSASSESLPDGQEAPAKGIKFTNAWAKDFHVSPFNSRKGTYSLTAADPVASLRSRSKPLDNLIVLNSSKAHAKLVARVFSEGDAIDPPGLSSLQTAKLLKSWFWVGFMTFPRIIAQAYNLYFKRKLHVWFRPEVLASSIGRDHTYSEGTLEAFFRGYIASLVDNASQPLRLTYIPPGSLGTTITMTSKHEKSAECKTLTLQVLSPAFYTRFPHYSHVSEALDREGLHADPKNRTISISNGENLPLLLAAISTTTHPAQTIFSRLRWALLKKLRSPPPAVAYPESKAGDEYTIKDIRTLPPSPLDNFALSLSLSSKPDSKHSEMIINQLSTTDTQWYRTSTNLSEIYRRTVTKVFIADNYCLGFEGIVDLLDLSLRVALVVLWFYANIGGKGDSKVCITLEEFTRSWWEKMLRRVGRWSLAHAVHLWAFGKEGMGL